MNHPHTHPHAERPHDPRDAENVDPDVVNSGNHYSLHAVFQSTKTSPADPNLEEALAATGVEIRGFYDMAGFRSDADLMLWAVADDATKLQAAFHVLKNSELGLSPVWSSMSRHMTAEFNTRHLPACFGGVAPRAYCAVYPLNRSWDWYYLPKARRAAMLKEHGLNGRDYLDVQVSTLASFALGDYEWTISLEADSLDRIMGVLRQQRESEARLFVREDAPFYTGTRVSLAEWAARQTT